MNSYCNNQQQSSEIRNNLMILLQTLLCNLARRTSAYVKQINRHRRERKAMRELAQFDEASLKDIGLTHGDLMWASRLPKSINATAELEIIARRASRD